MHKISSCAPTFGAALFLPAALGGDLAPGLRATSRAALGEVRGLLGFLGLDPVPMLPAAGRSLVGRSAVALTGAPPARPAPTAPTGSALHDDKQSAARPVRLHLGAARRPDRAPLREALAPSFQPVVDATCEDGTVIWQAQFAHRVSGLPYHRQVLQVKLIDTLLGQFHIHEPEPAGAKLVALIPPTALAVLQGTCRTAEEAALALCNALAELPVPPASNALAHGAFSTDMPALWRGFGSGTLKVAGIEGDVDAGLQARVAAVHRSLCAALAPWFPKAGA